MQAGKQDRTNGAGNAAAGASRRKTSGCSGWRDDHLDDSAVSLLTARRHCTRAVDCSKNARTLCEAQAPQQRALRRPFWPGARACGPPGAAVCSVKGALTRQRVKLRVGAVQPRQHVCQLVGRYRSRDRWRPDVSTHAARRGCAHTRPLRRLGAARPGARRAGQVAHAVLTASRHGRGRGVGE